MPVSVAKYMSHERQSGIHRLSQMALTQVHSGTPASTSVQCFNVSIGLHGLVGYPSSASNAVSAIALHRLGDARSAAPAEIVDVRESHTQLAFRAAVVWEYCPAGVQLLTKPAKAAIPYKRPVPVGCPKGPRPKTGPTMLAPADMRNS